MGGIKSCQAGKLDDTKGSLRKGACRATGDGRRNKTLKLSISIYWGIGQFSRYQLTKREGGKSSWNWRILHWGEGERCRNSLVVHQGGCLLFPKRRKKRSHKTRNIPLERVTRRIKDKEEGDSTQKLFREWCFKMVKKMETLNVGTLSLKKDVPGRWQRVFGLVRCVPFFSRYQVSYRFDSGPAYPGEKLKIVPKTNLACTKVFDGRVAGAWGFNVGPCVRYARLKHHLRLRFTPTSDNPMFPQRAWLTKCLDIFQGRGGGDLVLTRTQDGGEEQKRRIGDNAMTRLRSWSL